MLHSLVRRHVLAPSIQLRRVFFFTTGTSASSSSSSSSGATAAPDPHFMVEYLVKTWGFSADDASKVSKLLPRIHSTKNPDAVLRFFRSHGLDGDNLRRLIARKPEFLRWDMEKNLAPKFQFLRDVGLSESEVIDVVRMNPVFIRLNFQNTLLPKLKVWESLFGSKEILGKNVRRCGRFLSTNIENVVRPNLNFLAVECGIPEDRVSRLLRTHPNFIVQKPDSLRALVDRVEGIGITRGSGMFVWILEVLHTVSREKFEAQIKLMNSFGWSNSDFIAAFKKHPTFLCLSTDSLQRKIEFLVKDVGMAHLDIAKQPVFLRLSLEKRLIPRFHVMEILKSEGLWTSKNKLSTFFSLPVPKFLLKYVLPYQDKLPKLHEVL